MTRVSLTDMRNTNVPALHIERLVVRQYQPGLLGTQWSSFVFLLPVNGGGGGGGGGGWGGGGWGWGGGGGVGGGGVGGGAVCVCVCGVLVSSNWHNISACSCCSAIFALSELTCITRVKFGS